MTPLEWVEASGCLLWTVAYVVMIRRQFLDRHYGLPLTALALNLTWEVWHGGVLIWAWNGLDTASRLVLLIDVTWIALDLVLIAQVIRFARERGERRYGFPAFLLLCAPALLFHIAIDRSFREPTGYYSGFLADLVMFFLVALLVRHRGSNRGFSLAFFALTLVADLMMIGAFIGFYGFGLFSALFLGLRVTAGALCIGFFARNRATAAPAVA